MFEKELICHYTNEEKAISILKSKQINFNSFAKCNDPRESKQWNFCYIGNGQQLCLKEYRNTPDVFDQFIKNYSMILCFCGWNNEKMKFENNAIPPYRQDYYRVGWARSRMWSQYGDKYRGVCLVFDKSKLEEQFSLTFGKNKKFADYVEYQYHLISFIKATKIECKDILKFGVKKSLEMQINKYFHEFYFLKLMDYRDEQEYRLVVIVDDGNFVTLPIESSLKSVILGVDFPRQDYEKIDKLTKDCNNFAKTYILDWQEGCPQLQEFINNKCIMFT